MAEMPAPLAALLAATQLLAPAAWAGQISGTARLQQPLARVLGRTRIQAASQRGGASRSGERCGC